MIGAKSVVFVALLGACGRLHFDSGVDATAPLGAGWTRQLELTFDNAARGEDLIDMPVLVVLDPSRIDYGQLLPGGADLRFVDAGGAPLPYEIEQWIPAGTSLVWLRVPRIAAHSTTDHVVLVFGNPAAVDAQDRAGVWTESYAGVWHFATLDVADSTGHGNAGALRGSLSSASFVQGRVGTSLAFNGVDDYVEVPDADSLDVTALTLEGWVRVTELTTTHTILSKDGVGTDTTGAYNSYVYNAGPVVYETNNATSTVNACCVAAGDWHWFTHVVDAGATAYVYLDGALAVSRAYFNPIPLSTNLLFGRRGLADQFLSGSLDELRISSVARSADWISAQYASQTDTLITYGPQQPH